MARFICCLVNLLLNKLNPGGVNHTDKANIPIF